jgi:hypothetical protein
MAEYIIWHFFCGDVLGKNEGRWGFGFWGCTEGGFGEAFGVGFGLLIKLVNSLFGFSFFLSLVLFYKCDKLSYNLVMHNHEFKELNQIN